MPSCVPGLGPGFIAAGVEPNVAQVASDAAQNEAELQARHLGVL